MVTRRVKAAEPDHLFGAFQERAPGLSDVRIEQGRNPSPAQAAFESKMAGNQQVLERSQLREELRILKGLDQPGRGDLVRWASLDFSRFPYDRARGWLRQPCDQVE